MQFTGLVYWVQENTISEKFYKKIGFKVSETGASHSVVSLGEDLKITLVNMRDNEEFSGDAMSAEKGKGLYIYIKVDKVDDLYASFVKRGIRPASRPREWDWGNREFVVSDPDGYKFCFWQKAM